VIEPSRAALGWYLMLPKRKDKLCEARDSTIVWILNNSTSKTVLH
jgi:hypothetical protein